MLVDNLTRSVINSGFLFACPVKKCFVELIIGNSEFVYHRVIAPRKFLSARHRVYLQ